MKSKTAPCKRCHRAKAVDKYTRYCESCEKLLRADEKPRHFATAATAITIGTASIASPTKIGIQLGASVATDSGKNHE